MFTQLSAPVSLQWEVTPWCNFSCRHCYNYWRGGRTLKPKIDRGTLLLWDKVVSEIVGHRVFAVTVTGGEPLSVFHEVRPFIRSLVKNGVHVGINSNVSLVTDGLAAEIAALGVSSVLASLPSSNPTSNAAITRRKTAFAQTVRGIRALVSAGVFVTVNMVVTKLNLSEVFSTAEFVASLGVRSFSATKASKPPNCPDFTDYELSLSEFRSVLRDLIRVREELNLRVNSLEFYPMCSFGDPDLLEAFGATRACTAGRTSCTIGFDGRMRPCAHAPQLYGNASDGLGRAWVTMGVWRSDEYLPVECNPCRLKKRCGGGCKIQAMLTSGSLNKPDPFCDFSQLPMAVPQKSPWMELGLPPGLVLNSRLRLREEEFGGIAFVRPMCWVPVNTLLYRFLLARKEEVSRAVTVGDLVGVLTVATQKAEETLKYLYSKEVLRAM